VKIVDNKYKVYISKYQKPGRFGPSPELAFEHAEKEIVFILDDDVVHLDYFFLHNSREGKLQGWYFPIA